MCNICNISLLAHYISNQGNEPPSADKRCQNRPVIGYTRVVTGHHNGFFNNKKMVTILHREQEHKVKNVQHMKLEVMQPKTNINHN